MTPTPRIVRLHERDTLDAFSCGSDADAADLDAFLRTTAKKEQRARRSATWLAWHGETLVGFTTSLPGSVAANQVQAHVEVEPPRRVSVLILARMATLAGMQRTGIGKCLLAHVFAEAQALADRHGCNGIFVNPKEKSVGFYEKFGFKSLSDKRKPPSMFVSLAALPGAGVMT